MPRFLISILASVANNRILCKIVNAPALKASTDGSFFKKLNMLIFNHMNFIYFYNLLDYL